MSSDWVRDIKEMHSKYRMHQPVKELSTDRVREFIDWRMAFLDEELNESKEAETPADLVDGLIDLCVVAIGTLDLLGVDVQRAWDSVHGANMLKTRGMKDSRPNPFGFPDLLKPTGWVPPDHDSNVGTAWKAWLA